MEWNEASREETHEKIDADKTQEFSLDSIKGTIKSHYDVLYWYVDALRRKYDSRAWPD